MSDHLAEDQLTLLYYGETGDRAATEVHLAECLACREAYQSLQRVLNSVDSFPVPDRGENYGQEVWARIAPRLPRRSRWTAWLSPRRWAPLAGLAALILLAFLAGRYTRMRPGGTTTASASQVRDRVLLVAVGDHLERSQMVLIEVANAAPGSEVDLTGEKLMAENLVDSNRLFRQTATATGETGVVSVLDDLERVLLDISHSPDTVSSVELKDLQERIQDQGLLFRVRVVGSQLRQRDRKPVQSGSTKL